MAVWHNWANTCARFKRFKEALERNGQALALVPDDFDVLQVRGNIVAGLGQQAHEAEEEAEARRLLEEALDWHTRALAVADTDAHRNWAHGGRATRLRALGRYAEADVANAAALALKPDNGGVWYNRAINALEWGEAEAVEGRKAEAARILAAGEDYAREALRCSPNDQRIHGLLTSIQQARAQLGK